MRILWTAVVACAVVSCGGDDGAEVAGPDAAVDASDSGTGDTGDGAGPPDAAAPDAGSPDAAAPDAGSPDAATPDAGSPDAATTTCTAADPEACLYTPPAFYEVEVTTNDSITYTDALGEQRTVPLAIYRPVGAPMPAPVVLLSHGGATGKTNPLKSMDAWAPAFAKAGYVAIAMAHAGREDASFDAMCDHLGVPDTIQCAIKINWDRPHDVAQVLDWLFDAAQGAPWKDAVDLTRIGHVGHSAGAGCGLMLAGATRNFACAQPLSLPPVPCDEADMVSLAEPRISAVLAFSPQGPGWDGFQESSFSSVAVPLLVGTGLHDGDPGEPDNRKLSYELSPPGDKHLIYIDDPGAQHTFFEAELEACEKHQTTARCATMRSWLLSTAIAFADAHLRDNAGAKAWLATSNIETAGEGAVTWSSK